jgi:hypothetical protein
MTATRVPRSIFMDSMVCSSLVTERKKRHHRIEPDEQIR